MGAKLQMVSVTGKPRPTPHRGSRNTHKTRKPAPRRVGDSQLHGHPATQPLLSAPAPHPYFLCHRPSRTGTHKHSVSFEARNRAFPHKLCVWERVVKHFQTRKKQMAKLTRLGAKVFFPKALIWGKHQEINGLAQTQLSFLAPSSLQGLPINRGWWPAGASVAVSPCPPLRLRAPSTAAQSRPVGPTRSGAGPCPRGPSPLTPRPALGLLLRL